MSVNASDSQHYRLLQLHHLPKRRRNRHRSPPSLMGLRSHQLPLRLARRLDNRHLRPPPAPPLHLPKHVLDPPSRRLLFLDPRLQLRPPGSHRLLHLPLRYLLLTRRRPRPLHLQRGNFSPFPPRNRTILWCRDEQLLGFCPFHVAPAYAESLQATGHVRFLRWSQFHRLLDDFLVVARNQATYVGGTGLCLCRPDAYAYEIPADDCGTAFCEEVYTKEEGIDGAKALPF
jgi:hypothetical protein